MSALEKKYGGKHDPINHPSHYNLHPSGIEVIELTREMPFGPGNAVKYMLRREHKGSPVENIDKALFYIEDSLDAGINYRFSATLRRKALEVISAEPSANVGSFISSLCFNGFDKGWFLGREPDYELARDLCGVIREEYA